MRGATVTVNCKCCGEAFVARVADRNRGWAKFCSKSCKAIKQTQTGVKRTRHDGVSPMKHKFCHCGERAVNGVYASHLADPDIEAENGIIWLCDRHMATESAHPFSSEALGQW